LEGDEPKIGVHVRRGDYLTPFNAEYHGICHPSYYREAVELIKRQTSARRVYVVSDDPVWCQEHLDTPCQIVSSPNRSVFDDFQFLQGCDHLVISNSSLSWWAARLSSARSQTVVAPYPWFGSVCYTPDLLIENWFQLNRKTGRTAEQDESEAAKTTVCVVIPTRQRASLLPSAVDSAINQTHPPTEIVLALNDASEAVEQIADGYARNVPNIRVMKSPIASLSRARNIGIESTECEWCAFLDDDDIWEPNKIEAQLRTATRMSSDAVSCDYSTFNDRGEINLKGLRHKAQGLTWRQALTLENVFSGGSAAMVKTGVLRKIGLFDENLVASEDIDMWRRIALEHDLFVVPEKLVRIRRSSNSMSSNAQVMLAGELAHNAKKLRDATGGAGKCEMQALISLHAQLWTFIASNGGAPSNCGELNPVWRRAGQAVLASLPSPVSHVARQAWRSVYSAISFAFL
jgi:hypothetical protein